MHARGRRIDALYGRGTHELEDDGEEAAIVEESLGLRHWLESYLKQPKVDLPRPPAVALEIIKLSKEPNVKIEDLAALIEREPLLAARVLKLANSALYGAIVPCVTLKQSLVRVGIAKVRDVVMEAALTMTVIRAEGFESSLMRIQRHSAGVAWLSRLVARRTSIEAENAFLIGLLHDIGLSVGVVALCEYLKNQKKPAVLTSPRWNAVEHLHELLSEQVLTAWGLPAAMTMVVRNHHSLKIGGYPHPSVAVLMIAEKLASELGWSSMPVSLVDGGLLLEANREGDSFDATNDAAKLLALTPKQIEVLREEAKKELALLSSHFAAQA